MNILHPAAKGIVFFLQTSYTVYMNPERTGTGIILELN